MLNIYEIWVLLIYLIIFLTLFLVFYPIYLDYKIMKGKNRKISGEVLRDIGIGLLVGAGLQYRLFDLAYYVLILISTFLIIIGVRMKYDDK
jgi:hypothetical protein